MSTFRQGTELMSVIVVDYDPTTGDGVPGGTPYLFLIRTDIPSLYYYNGPLDTDWVQVGNSSSDNLVFNVKDFGATGNGITDDSDDIRDAITAASDAGGGVVYFPNGTYIISEDDSDSACLILPSDVTLYGQSKESAIIKMAAGQASSVRPILVGVPGGASVVSDVRIANLTIDGNKLLQSTDEHRAGIFLWNSLRTVIEDVILQNNTGDGVDIFVAQFTVVQRCFCLDNDRKAITIDGGPSSYMAIRDCEFVGNKEGAVVCEAEVACQWILVEDCYCGYPTDPGVCVSMGPFAQDSHLRGLQIFGGLEVYQATRTTVSECYVETDADGNQPLFIGEFVDYVIIDSCTIYQPLPQANNEIIIIQGSESVGPQPTNVIIQNCDIITAWDTSNGILINNANNVWIRDNRLQNTASGNTATAIASFATDASQPPPTQGNVIVEGNYILGWLVGISAGLNTGGLTMGPLVVNDNLIDTCTNAYNMSTSDGGPSQVEMAGNDTVNVTNVWQTVSDPTPRITYPPCPILISGLRGAGGVYQCSGSPNSQIAEIIGAMALQRDGSGGIVGWIKTSGSGDTGWQSINVT
jgi:hypothetical protein